MNESDIHLKNIQASQQRRNQQQEKKNLQHLCLVFSFKIYPFSKQKIILTCFNQFNL